MVCKPPASGARPRFHPLSPQLTEERWNDGTLLHLPTLQPITSVTCFSSALSTPRFLGDCSNWAWPELGRLISPLTKDRLCVSKTLGSGFVSALSTGQYLRCVCYNKLCESTTKHSGKSFLFCPLLFGSVYFSLHQ